MSRLQRAVHLVFGIAVVMLGAAALIWTLGGCSPSAQEIQIRTADAVGQVANVGGEALAAWSVADTDCGGLTDADCAQRAYEKHAAIWRAWDAFAAAHGAYLDALEAGGDPQWESVLRAYCALVAAMPESSPSPFLQGLAACP